MRGSESARARRSGSTAPRSGARLSGLAGAALLLGLVVYLADRPAGSALLIPAIAALRTGPLFGDAAGWLPSFVHVFALSLLSASVWPRRAGGPPYAACALWWVIDVAFEAGQHAGLAGALVWASHRALGDGALASALTGYFARGRFDPADVAAATAGALAAAAVLRVAHQPRRSS